MVKEMKCLITKDEKYTNAWPLLSFGEESER